MDLRLILSPFFSLVLFRLIGRLSSLHQLHLGALGTDDVLVIGDEAATYQRGLAARANETVVVPMPVLERDETGAANS